MGYPDDLEERIYDLQEKWIEKRFGREAADMANYGSGVDEGENHVTIETKVYGHGVLITSASNIESITNEFRSF